MQPTRELAISLNKEVKLYGKWRNEMDYFDNSLKCQEEHPIDFDKAWVNLGFSRRQEGKRSLLGVCDEGKDFDLRINAQLTGVLEEKRGDYEIIKLSADGFIKWAMYAQTPVAKASVGELIKRLRYITKENTELKKSIRAQSWKAYLLDFVESRHKEHNRLVNELAELISGKTKDGYKKLLDQQEFEFGNYSISEVFIKFYTDSIESIQNETFFPNTIINDNRLQISEHGKEDDAA